MGRRKPAAQLGMTFGWPCPSCGEGAVEDPKRECDSCREARYVAQEAFAEVWQRWWLTTLIEEGDRVAHNAYMQWVDIEGQQWEPLDEIIVGLATMDVRERHEFQLGWAYNRKDRDRRYWFEWSVKRHEYVGMPTHVPVTHWVEDWSDVADEWPYEDGGDPEPFLVLLPDRPVWDVELKGELV